jgi:hypothetical protein
MKTTMFLAALLCASLVLPGCATSTARGPAQPRAAGPAPQAARGLSSLSTEAKEKILALDPENVTDRDVRELLSNAPAPQIISIHGGLLPIKKRMISFAEFLIAMGYPAASLRNPKTGSYAYGYYDDSDRIAGSLAWYYEQEGLRPILVGHSLGGIQVVRVLHKLAGDSEKQLSVWNPLTDEEEPRYEITDPLTGTKRPVIGLQLCYATAATAGGLARALPNEWDMNGRLREIPDSVEEFTGFQKGFDPFGGDYLGYGKANDYHPTGKAVVRNVRLPASGAHLTIPDAKNLLKSTEIRDWINNYRPVDLTVNDSPPDPKFGSKSARVLWAADVWYSIKKHWVLELQRRLRTQHS